MTLASPVTQIINTATAQSLAVGDRTTWYRGSRFTTDNKAPPRYVWYPKSDGHFTYGIQKLQDGQTFANPVNRWTASERISVFCWGADYDDAWRLRANAIDYLTVAMANGGGSWRLLGGWYRELDKAKNVDRGEVYELAVEFDIPVDQARAVEIQLTPINIIGEMDWPDGKTLIVFNTTAVEVPVTGKLGTAYSFMGNIAPGWQHSP
jgi:hypothetical protein